MIAFSFPLCFPNIYLHILRQTTLVQPFSLSYSSQVQFATPLQFVHTFYQSVGAGHFNTAIQMWKEKSKVLIAYHILKCWSYTQFIISF